VTEVTSTQRWKVGKIASATGLTVRTLHHYDQIALVCPSGRTPSGHRLYEQSDVQRTYQVLALRQLGLPLDKIGEVLSGSTSVEEVLAAHHRFLADQLAAVRALSAQVGTLASILREVPGASVEDFLELIQKVIVVNETVKQYFDADQLADLAQRRERLGEGVFADVQAGWADLLPKVADAVESGMDPASPEAQAMAARWMELLEQFHGGDEGLRQGLYRMQAESAEQIEREHGGPSPVQLDFIKAANAARN
jgi:MerR family transcriptional regulator, thiopeptide resistance regulator